MSFSLKKIYEKVWVPILGRAVMLFAEYIEGKKPKTKPTYKLKEK
tara:strand:- start:350 stop:484 length:135 start_codon:yes stop_codon:yes gene_type:complete